MYMESYALNRVKTYRALRGESGLQYWGMF